MSFENRGAAKGSERLEEPEAQLEANMVKMKLAQMIRHEPTAADYDRALQAVEEIKRLAEEEPQFDKIALRIAQIGNKYFNDVADGLLWIFTLGRLPDERTRQGREMSLHAFDDAQARLEQLRRQAELEQTNSAGAPKQPERP